LLISEGLKEPSALKIQKYLVSKDKDYYDKLSDASKQTLEYQGGKMSIDEMKEFETHPEFNNILKVRYYDDIGKQMGIDIPRLESFYNLIEKYLN